MLVSFIHRFPTLASHRYRCSIPAKELGLPVNEGADSYVICKPTPLDLPLLYKPCIVDFCDDHFDKQLYLDFAERAAIVTCPTEAMAKIIKEKTGRDATVIFDPYESEEKEPHCVGEKLLWFGHASNLYTLERILPDLDGYDLHIVSNAPGTIPWSLETMKKEFARADIVILPATKDYKSPNRALESIRNGCYVVAEPHPSLEGIPIYQGNIKEGLCLTTPNQTTKLAQDYIRERFSPKTQALAWKKVLTELTSIWGVAKNAGRDGSTWTMRAQT